MERKIADTRHGYLARSIPIGDKIGNFGSLEVKGTPKEPIYFVKNDKPIVPVLKKEVKEPNGHIDEKEIIRLVAERWRNFI